MKRIPLTQGKIALVDSADYEELLKFQWHAQRNRAQFYAARSAYDRRNGKQKTIYMHRAILKASPGMEIDHRNHNALDNRRQNLRACTHSENLQNQEKSKKTKCSSRFKGVSWYEAGMKWQAQIKLNGKLCHLGRRETEVECAQLYDTAAKKLFGDFANVNFPHKE